MQDCEDLKEAVRQIGGDPANNNDLKIAAEALKLLAEADCQKAQALKFGSEGANFISSAQESKARLSADSKRFFASLVTPLVTVVVLGTSLILQTKQFDDSSKRAQTETNLKYSAEEDARWAVAVGAAADKKTLEATILLKGFLKSPRYSEPAYNLESYLLTQCDNEKEYETIFAAVYSPVTWDEFDKILDLDREFVAGYEPLLARVKEAQTHLGQRGQPTKMEAIDQAKQLEGDARLWFLGRMIGGVFKYKKPLAKSIDLSNTFIENCDFSDADLSGADVSGSIIQYVSLRGTDLSGIKKFADINWQLAAWWKAAKISPALLKELETSSPYNPNLKDGYGATSGVETITSEAQAQYARDVQRLENGGSKG